jgi:hypothetical protein
MAEVHGLRALRLIAGQPVALGSFGLDFSTERGYFVELEFNDGSIIAVPVKKLSYDNIIATFSRQKVAIEQRIVVRDRATVEGEQKKAAGEEPLPLDATPQDVAAALNRTKPTEDRPYKHPLLPLDSPLWPWDSDDEIPEEESDE